MSIANQIVERLQMCRVAVDGLTCMWCPNCMHVILKDPKVKGAEVINLGDDNCRLRIKSGTISEAIADLQQTPGA